MMQSPEKSARAYDPFGDVEDVTELRRMVAYFRKLADDNGARLLRAEAIASRNRQELEQKTRGFSLLARLSYDVSATEDPAFVARIVTGHLNGMLNMNRSVVLLRDASGAAFSILGSAGYTEEEQQSHACLKMDLPPDMTRGRRVISTLEPLSDDARSVFGPLGLRYFMAVPVIADEEVKAVIVTGRMREGLPFLPPLNASDLETVLAISGFFGAYLARHSLIMRDREHIIDVERLVTERTAEIEWQRELLDESVQRLRETQQQLILREKLASLGQLMAGVAHEIRNPLNFINNFSELSCELAQEIEEMTTQGLDVRTASSAAMGDLFTMLRSNLEKIAAHGRRADGIVENMLQHSRGGGHVAELCDLNAILTESIDFALHAARAKDPGFDVSITRDFDMTLGLVMLSPQEISRVFVNLLSNGFYALGQRMRTEGEGYAPTLLISTSRKPDMVEVRLRDNGVGMPDEIRDRIFTPFFSTKPPGEGTGLGLSLSYDIIVNGLGGAIAVDSRENEFTEFVIRLPRG